MNERENSVFGGEMSQEEFTWLEFGVDEGFPNWKIETEGKVFRMATAVGELVMNYTNTKIYMFDPPYDWMSHIYHKQKPDATPLYVTRPDDEEEAFKYDDMVDEMICAGFRFMSSGYPEASDLDTWYVTFRGNDPIETVVEKILEEDV